MEVIFRDNTWFYYIEDNIIKYEIIEEYPGDDLANIAHLKDAEIISHYRSINNGMMYPVYYEHNGRIISSMTKIMFYTLNVGTKYIKDYTLVNVKLLDNI